MPANFFKRTNNVVENFNDGEGYGVDNRDVGSQQNVKIIFFSIDKKQFLDNCCKWHLLNMMLLFL